VFDCENVEGLPRDHRANDQSNHHSNAEIDGDAGVAQIEEKRIRENSAVLLALNPVVASIAWQTFAGDTPAAGLARTKERRLRSRPTNPSAWLYRVWSTGKL